jgi:hypothetical protein
MGRPRRPLRARRRALPVLLLLALGAACGHEAPPPAAAPARPPADVFVAEGEALLARGDYAGALPQFERAVALAPEHIAARYGLGTALSHLDRTQEAVAQFQWVDRLGGARSPLASRAREWLARHGALAPRPTARGEHVPFDQQAPARVRGTLSWSGFLTGGDTPVELELRRQDVRGAPTPYRMPARVPGAYEFPRVAPGNYQLHAWTRSPRVELWRQFLVVQQGVDVQLDLTPGNAVAPADALPLPDPRAVRERANRR